MILLSFQGVIFVVLNSLRDSASPLAKPTSDIFRLEVARNRGENVHTCPIPGTRTSCKTWKSAQKCRIPEKRNRRQTWEAEGGWRKRTGEEEREEREEKRREEKSRVE